MCDSAGADERKEENADGSAMKERKYRLRVVNTIYRLSFVNVIYRHRAVNEIYSLRFVLPQDS
jgi:hypothetical protein